MKPGFALEAASSGLASAVCAPFWQFLELERCHPCPSPNVQVLEVARRYPDASPLLSGASQLRIQALASYELVSSLQLEWADWMHLDMMVQMHRLSLEPPSQTPHPTLDPKLQSWSSLNSLGSPYFPCCPCL